MHGCRYGDHPSPEQHRVRQHGTRPVGRHDGPRRLQFSNGRGGVRFRQQLRRSVLSPVLLEAYDTVAQTLAQNAVTGSARTNIMTCTPAAGSDACARQILGPLAKRAWRRPVTDQELSELLAQVTLATQQGDGFDTGIEQAIRVMLVSPNFVYRAEIDPDPTSTTSHPLNDYELASRLSYFLWSSMPDDMLFAAADAGKLTSDSAELDRQAQRMLADPRAQGLPDTFALQWLTRGLDQAVPDPMTYPAFSDAVRTSMYSETREFMRSFLFGDVNFLDIIDAPYTWADQNIAMLYGLSGATGTTMTRVSVDPSTHRGGLLTQASILTLTSISTRTSPTRRGNWVLTNLLCDPTPPPPVSVPPLQAPSNATTIRELLADHAKNPACSPCHTRLDPIGLGMENYDGIGAWRMTYPAGQAIDPTGALTQDTPDAGVPYSGTMQLEPLIKTDPRFAKCATSKLYAFALGRAPTTQTDACRVESLAATFEAKSYRMKDFIMAVIDDDAFRMRHGGN